MSKRPIQISISELAGSMGDFGTLLPLAIGYIVVCRLNPAGFLVMMGLANVISGLAYRLPMPIEPMKALAVVAIAQQWSPSMVGASGFGMGVTWLVLAVTGAITWIAQVTPSPVVMGVQVTLGVLLAREAVALSSSSWPLAIAGVIVVLTLRRNKYAPATIVLVGAGLLIMLLSGKFEGLAFPEFHPPGLASFTFKDVWQTMLLGGFAQIPLTAANAVIATSSIINVYWPDAHATPRRLAFSHAVMNLTAPLFGGMPMCHGAGGLVGQYFYGARTAGANLIEGTIEIVLGLFFASSIVTLFAAFPQAIVGAMMFMVGFQLVKAISHLRGTADIVIVVLTVTVALLTNMALGFATGILVHRILALASGRLRRQH